MKLIRVTILCRTQEECVKKDFLCMIKIGMAGAREFFLTSFLSRAPNHSRRIQQLQLF